MKQEKKTLQKKKERKDYWADDKMEMIGCLPGRMTLRANLFEILSGVDGKFCKYSVNSCS